MDLKYTLLSEKKVNLTWQHRYDPNHMIFWKRQNYGGNEWISGCQELGKGRMTRQSMQDFEGSQTNLFDTVMMDACYYTVFKTHKMYNTKNETQSTL